MSDKKQTAVEIFAAEIADILIKNNIKLSSKALMEFSDSEIKAKALEREQMKERCIECYKDGFMENVRPRHDDAEEYYRETYESDYFTKNYGDAH